MMSEAIVNFETENRDGVVAVGTYLIDAARRLGIKVESDCGASEDAHKCGMKGSAGMKLLSAPTRLEMEKLSSQARRSGKRLSCQARIEKSGEVTVAFVEKNEKTKTEEEEKQDAYRKEFEALPLEKKVSNLVELEAITLNEIFSFVLNSPYEAVGKIMDFMAEFGMSKDKADEEAKLPNEHKSSAQRQVETREKKKTDSEPLDE
jgi:ferredoxin